MSQELNFLQRVALNRLGDVICPENGEFPAFSDLDVVHHADIVLKELLDRLKILCDPTNHILTGHAVWHILNAGAVFFIYRFYSQFELRNE